MATCREIQCCDENPFAYQSADISLTDGLLAYWKFEEASGNRVDATGNGNDLVPTNAPGNIEGKIDMAVDIEKSSAQTLEVASNDFTEINGDFTLAGWVFFESLVTGSATNENCFVSKYRRSAPTTGVRLRYWHIPQLIQLFSAAPTAGTSNIVQAATFGTPVINTWYWVCAWYDSSTGKYYIQINDTVPDSVAGSAPVDNGLPFMVGDFYNSSSADTRFDGRLDEWGKWNRVLSAAERAYLYNYGIGRTLFD